MSRTPCPPAAATSSARLALSCPATSAKSAESSSATDGDPRRGVGRHRHACSHSASSASAAGAAAGSLGTSDASATFARGSTIKRRICDTSRRADTMRAMESAPRTGRSAAIQPELADEGVTCDRVRVQHAGADEHSQRDRQVEGGAFLPHVGRREVRGDPSRRHGEARVEQGGTDALAALLHRAGRQADGDPLRQTRGDVHLDGDVVGIDAEHCGGADGGEHAA